MHAKLWDMSKGAHYFGGGACGNHVDCGSCRGLFCFCVHRNFWVMWSDVRHAAFCSRGKQCVWLLCFYEQVHLISKLKSACTPLKQPSCLYVHVCGCLCMCGGSLRKQIEQKRRPIQTNMTQQQPPHHFKIKETSAFHVIRVLHVNAKNNMAHSRAPTSTLVKCSDESTSSLLHIHEWQLVLVMKTSFSQWTIYRMEDS